MKQTITNEATLKILNILFERRIYAWRNSTGALGTRGHFYQMGKVGSSDIFALLPPNGRFLGIEIKTGADQLRPEQEGFIKNVQQMGGGIIVVRGQTVDALVADFNRQLVMALAFEKVIHS